MHFFVDHDSGSSISGWVVPDNPGDVPNFVIRVPGRPDVKMSANVLRADLRDLGLHSTGLAGFNIDQQYVGDLAEIADVTIIDGGSGIPIYRRPDPSQHIDKKLLLLDVAIFPQIRIIRRIMASFALAYPVVDRFPIETISAVLANKAASSIFVTGQPNWSRHGSLAREKEYITAALLRDPFEDLAERLLFIGHLAKRSNRNGLNASLEKYENVVEFIAEMDFSDRKSLLTGFRKMAPECRTLFRSPMTTVFGGAPESELQRRNVSVALDSLAQFDIVGVRPLFDDFASMLDASLAAPIVSGSQLEILPGTLELAANLGELGLVADLLDEDIALYSFACEAVEAGLKIAYEHRKPGPSGQSPENI